MLKKIGLSVLMSAIALCCLMPVRAADRNEFAAFERGAPMFLGCNYWASHAGVYMWRDWRPETVAADLDRLAAHGMTVLRVFPLWPDFQPLTADFGGGQSFAGYSQAGGPLANEAAVDEVMMARFRWLCDEAEKREIRLVVGLITGWMSGRTFVPPALERMKVLADPEAIRWQVRFVRHFVRALKDHPAICAWDLGNECNCLGGVDEAGLWAWMHQIAAEIRLNDPTRPVVSGMHSCSTRRGAQTNLRQQGELMDVLTTHPYPLWTPNCNFTPFDSLVNACHAACETTLYADMSGKPAFVEEAGSMGPQIVSEARAAATMRMALFNCWANGIAGYMWWCAFDQNHLDFAPYEWTAIERELGLFTSAGEPKPTALQLREFRAFLDTLPFKTLGERQIDAVVVLSENEDAWRTAQGAWLLAKRAGFDIRYARAEDPLPESRFYILPSPLTDKYNAYSRRAYLRVVERARTGATVLITLGNGAILSDLEAVAGVRTENLYAAGSQTAVKTAWGEFSVPDSHTRAVTCPGAQVIWRDIAGEPALSVKRLGSGQVVFFRGAVEANAVPAGWPVYAQAAQLAGVRRCVRASVPSLSVTEHPRAGGGRIVVAVNCANAALEAPVEIDGRVVKVWRGACDGRTLTVAAADAAVFEIGEEPAP